jgi:CBS domain-containing protein
MSNETVAFLATVKPFDLLSEDELQKAAQNLSQNSYTSDKLLFVQNKTFLGQVYIVAEGRLEKYIQEQGRKDLSEVLEAKNIYGGLSTLFNRSLSIRTVKTLEKTTLYSLPREHFLDLCSRYPDFIQYFTGQYCSQMLQQPYMSFLARSAGTQDLRTSPGFLNLALHDIYSRDFAFCSQDLTIQDAARIMSEKKRSSIVVMNDQGQSVGLLTDNDLRRKVVSRNYPVHHPVGDIDSRPLITLSPRAQVFEAIMKMMKHNIKHLVITDDLENILGIATEQDLLLAQGKSPVYLMREIQLAEGIPELKARYKQLPGLIKSLMDGGARAGDLNRIITEISDAILKKIAGFSLEEEGKPPAPFAFMIMGSDGRMEQTLKTDQDNAIIYQDVEPELEKKAQAYFLQLGDKICTGLDEVGFSFCKFKVMAKNPKWCQPLSVWKKYFWNWIHNAEPIDLLHSSIFFDFRTGYGDQFLTDDLKNYLFRTLGDWMGFFRHLAENSLRFKPPLDFFGNLMLKKINNKKNCLDIKKPMQILVDFARIYALQHKISDTNTQDRLEKLRQLRVLDKQDYEELIHTYSFMMFIRLSHQVEMLVEEDKPADNYVLPRKLTYIHRQSLKDAFKGIRNAQGRMRMDLTQDIGIT